LEEITQEFSEVRGGLVVNSWVSSVMKWPESILMMKIHEFNIKCKRYSIFLRRFGSSREDQYELGDLGNQIFDWTHKMIDSFVARFIVDSLIMLDLVVSAFGEFVEGAPKYWKSLSILKSHVIFFF
jgi:hypothetical protein